jgi:ubiquinone/menaquinone biosynthesis C-methylase UbiE
MKFQMNEIESEGIAVNLSNAISLFRKEIDPKSKKSGKLFDEDLTKNNLVFLDVGCGIGRHLLVLRNNGFKSYIGFDIVEKLVQTARQDFDLKNIFVANALHIPLPNSSVHRCLLYNVIEHCSDPEHVLSEIKRVLKKDGFLYMDSPNGKSIGDRMFRWGGKLIYGRTSHIQHFTKKKILALIERKGFSVVNCKTMRGIFVDFPQLRNFGFIKRMLKLFFDNEVSGWELKLKKKTSI